MHSYSRHPASARAREVFPEAKPGLDHITTLLVQRTLREGGSLLLDEQAMRRLQSQAGNRAVNLALDRRRTSPLLSRPVQRLRQVASTRSGATAMSSLPRLGLHGTPKVQRDGADPEPEAEAPAATQSTLRAARFADSDRLQRAARNSPPLRLNDSDDAVARMQRAFLDLGYKMPITTKSGGPTGFYGPETAATVLQFQKDHGVHPPGGHEAGKKTLTKLDEICLKHDAPIEVTPPALTGGALHSTRPALETPNRTVSKPEAAATPTSTTPAPEAERQHRAQIEISGGLEGDIQMGKKPGPDEPPDFFCDHVKFQVDIKGNINVLKLGDRVTLLPNVGLGVNLPPVKCGKAPGVEAHVDLLKLKLSEATELGVMTSFQPQNTELTGWIAGTGISFEVKPSKSVPLSVGIEGKAGVERFPVGDTGHFLWLLQGGFAVKYEFGFF